MIAFIINWLSSTIRKDEEGQGLTEYALIIALVSIAAIIALGVISGGINDILNSIGATLSGKA